MPRTTSAVARASTDPEAVLDAFAEPTRLRLLALLVGGETCVCDLVSALRQPQPTVSRHLAVLRRAGLVRARRQGLWVHYSLAPAGCALHEKLLACLPCCRDELPRLKEQAERCSSLRDGRCC
jgi:ArsR family transcriptional regulator